MNSHRSDDSSSTNSIINLISSEDDIDNELESSDILRPLDNITKSRNWPQTNNQHNTPESSPQDLNLTSSQAEDFREDNVDTELNTSTTIAQPQQASSLSELDLESEQGTRISSTYTEVHNARRTYDWSDSTVSEIIGSKKRLVVLDKYDIHREKSISPPEKSPSILDRFNEPSTSQPRQGSPLQRHPQPRAAEDFNNLAEVIATKMERWQEIQKNTRAQHKKHFENTLSAIRKLNSELAQQLQQTCTELFTQLCNTVVQRQEAVFAEVMSQVQDTILRNEEETEDLTRQLIEEIKALKHTARDDNDSDSD